MAASRLSGSKVIGELSFSTRQEEFCSSLPNVTEVLEGVRVAPSRHVIVTGHDVEQRDGEGVEHKLPLAIAHTQKTIWNKINTLNRYSKIIK